MSKKIYKSVADLPVKEVGEEKKIVAPDSEHVNDPAYVQYRQEQAATRRPPKADD